MLLQLCHAIRELLPENVLQFQKFRDAIDERVFVYPMRIEDEDEDIVHLFTITVDDSTSPDHLIVNSIRHISDRDLLN